MKIDLALSLAERSMGDFENAIEDMKLKELYELTDNLRLVDNNSVFSTAKGVLHERLAKWHKKMKAMEDKHNKKDFEDIKHNFSGEQFISFKGTGFDVFNINNVELNILPSDFFKGCIEKVAAW